jgi:hypothetical protein
MGRQVDRQEMEHTDGRPPAPGDGADDLGPEDRLPGDDPRSRSRVTGRPVMPDDWVGEHDNDPMPDPARDAEPERESQEARRLPERGGGRDA